MNPPFDESLLTAFALNELPHDDAARVEAWLADHPESREIVAKIQSTAALMTAELARELNAQPAHKMPALPVRPKRTAWLARASAVAAAASISLGAWWYIHLNPQRSAPLASSSTRISSVQKVQTTQSIDPPDDREKTIIRLIAHARQLTDEGKFVEALTVIDNIQQLDPQNAYAGGVRQFLEDRSTNQRQRQYIESYNTTFTSQLNDAKERIVPYDDILRYASDWPKISAMRDEEVADERGEDSENQALSSSLERHLPDLRFNANSLADVIDFMRDATGTKIYIDWPALEKAGISRDAPVTLKLHDVKFSKAMGLILGSVSNASAKPGFRLEEGEIVVSIGEGYRPDGPRTQTESYLPIIDNPFCSPLQTPLSTFAVNVDSASYANIRRFIQGGQLPPPDAVRIEELINYFPSETAGPGPTDAVPLAVNVEISDCPWQPAHRLARISLKAKSLVHHQRPPCNLVFLIDVSGSMTDDYRLPLIKDALKKLVERLSVNDHVAIVTYAGSSQTALASTSCGDELIDNPQPNDDKYQQAVTRLWSDVYEPQIIMQNGKPVNLESLKRSYNDEVARLPHAKTTGHELIFNAIDRLNAKGETNGGDGIQLAYKTAIGSFIKGGVNRVILATDGDFNVGITDPDQLAQLIETQAGTGVFLTVLGVGTGNTKESTMEKLATHGKGNYAYLDSPDEAEKVLARQIDSTLVNVAKDVKVQIEFNPAIVASYRLIGYENRGLPATAFKDDSKSAGEMGAGHSAIALYELIPARPSTEPAVPLKYQRAILPTTNPAVGELMTVNVRYQLPEGTSSRLIEVPATDHPQALADTTTDYRFSVAVAAFGMILRNSPHRGNSTFDRVIDIATGAKANDPGGYRAQFIDLVKQAKAIAAK